MIVAPLVIIVGVGYLWLLSIGARFDYIQILQILLFALPYVVLSHVVNSPRFEPMLQRYPILSQLSNIALFVGMYIYLLVNRISAYPYLISLVIWVIMLLCTETRWWKNNIGRFYVELALRLIMTGILFVTFSLSFSHVDYWGLLWISVGVVALLVFVFFQLRKWGISSTRDS
jgi:hypothetical protein